LTADDVLKMTPKFWEMHLDPNIALDYGLFTILAAQINLTVGTLSRYLDTRPDLAPLVDSLLKGETIGLYLLSERGHGLDALNIETTAHQQEDGSYVLNTPREEATKYVHPPICKGYPVSDGVFLIQVYARLEPILRHQQDRARHGPPDHQG
jgi:acyl-CoA oxidase